MVLTLQLSTDPSFRRIIYQDKKSWLTHSRLAGVHECWIGSLFSAVEPELLGRMASAVSIGYRSTNFHSPPSPSQRPSTSRHCWIREGANALSGASCSSSSSLGASVSTCSASSIANSGNKGFQSWSSRFSDYRLVYSGGITS